MTHTSIFTGKQVIEWLEKNADVRLEMATEYGEQLAEGYDDLTYDDVFKNTLHVLKHSELLETKPIEGMHNFEIVMPVDLVNKLREMKIEDLMKIQEGIHSVIKDFKS